MNENMVHEIGARIQKLREDKGITQAQLADELGVRRVVVSKWELGIQDLKTEYTVKLAEFFGVSCDELLRGIAPPNSTVNYELGLTNKSIKALKEFKRLDYTDHLKIINGVLSGGEKLTDLLYSIEDYYDFFEAEKDLSGEGFGCIVENDPELFKALQKCRSVGMEIVDSYGRKKLAEGNIKSEFMELLDNIAYSEFGKKSDMVQMMSVLASLIEQCQSPDEAKRISKEIKEELNTLEKGDGDNGEH